MRHKNKSKKKVATSLICCVEFDKYWLHFTISDKFLIGLRHANLTYFVFNSIIVPEPNLIVI